MGCDEIWASIPSPVLPDGKISPISPAYESRISLHIDPSNRLPFFPKGRLFTSANVDLCCWMNIPCSPHLARTKLCRPPSRCIYNRPSLMVRQFSLPLPFPHTLNLLIRAHSKMYRQPLPLTLEDRTGQLTNSDFDDMYDRLFLHVARQPGKTQTKIYEMNIRASRHRSKQPLNRDPIIVLDFMPDESLGTVTFFKQPFQGSMPMSRYLKKTSFFGT